MTNVKISNRLKKIASMVDKGDVILDVGCDHALLDIYLINNNICKKAYAVDNKDGAIKNALNNVKRYNCLNVFVIKSDGFCEIDYDNDITTIILSGLGNITILNILNDLSKFKNLNSIIIQSNNDYYSIRYNMMKKGFKIIDEKLVLDKNILYVVIKFKKGNVKYNKKELFLGPILLKNKDELFNLFINNYINKYKKIINKLSRKKILLKLKYKFYIFLLKKELK